MPGETLGKAIERWFPKEQKRVTINIGDALEFLATLPDASVDVVFCANLICFFKPDQLDRFFQKCRRLFKKKRENLSALEWFQFFLYEKSRSKLSSMC